MKNLAPKKPTWTDLKQQLAPLDTKALLGLVHDLYKANKDNQTFLHARFALSADVLAPYKETIERWVFPDVMRNQDFSVSKAKKAITDYKKAVGDAEGVAELSVFYCECCKTFLSQVCLESESYFDALVRMFEQAAVLAKQIEPEQQQQLIARLQQVQSAAYDWGWNVFDDMTDILAAIGIAKE